MDIKIPHIDEKNPRSNQDNIAEENTTNKCEVDIKKHDLDLVTNQPKGEVDNDEYENDQDFEDDQPLGREEEKRVDIITLKQRMNVRLMKQIILNLE